MSKSPDANKSQPITESSNEGRYKGNFDTYEEYLADQLEQRRQERISYIRQYQQIDCHCGIKYTAARQEQHFKRPIHMISTNRLNTLIAHHKTLNNFSDIVLADIANYKPITIN